MTSTITEKEYQDWGEELNAKLHDERKLSSTQNTRIAELEEANGKMSAFIAAWEIHLAGGILSYGRSNKTGRALLEVQREYNELKTKHLGDSEGE